MQAVLIIAHRDFEQVYRLAKKLLPTFNVYIHFDKKMPLTNEQAKLLAASKIEWISEVDVNWGSWSIGEVAVRLFKLALLNEDNTYFHLISGQDWPSANVQDIYNFYEQTDKIYMTYELAKDVKIAGEKIVWWQQLYYNYDKIKRRTKFGKLYHRVILALQLLLRVNKLKKLGIELEIYHGANWVDIPRDALEYSIEYFDSHPKFRKMLETGCFSDEFWLQTILCNNDTYKARIVADNKRFVKWEQQNNSWPAVLDERDFDIVVKSHTHFARKFTQEFSMKLIEKLDSYYK